MRWLVTLARYAMQAGPEAPFGATTRKRPGKPTELIVYRRVGDVLIEYVYRRGNLAAPASVVVQASGFVDAIDEFEEIGDDVRRVLGEGPGKDRIHQVRRVATEISGLADALLGLCMAMRPSEQDVLGAARELGFWP